MKPPIQLSAKDLCHPEILRSEEEVAKMMAENPRARFVDAFSSQLTELFLIEEREFIGMPKEEIFKTAKFGGFCRTKRADYVHIYYPWNGCLVKCVSNDDYFTLRTNRNQDLITAEEQAHLKSYKVAIFGMSVGSNIALILTQAGISRKITIADLDVLETTNLNRILGGVHEVGVNKAVVAARRIYENDPFSEVSLMRDGVSEENLEEMCARGSADCIVDEIDDIGLKIRLRVLAMKHRVPVVMVTDNGDGVVLHVERYDLGHDRIFGKTVDHFLPKLEGPMTKEKAGQIIIYDIVGGPERVDPKMMASVKRVLDRELVSWSQLGSAAMLGAVIATVAIKKIALGESKEKDIRAHIQPFRIEVGSHA